MYRYYFVFALFFGADYVRAADRTPEQILPSSTQAYARWDGIAAHQKAYDDSARGKMYAGETGKVFDAVWSQLFRQLKLTQIGEPLLNGEAPDQLSKSLASIKKVVGLPKLLARTGLVAGLEIRPNVDFGLQKLLGIGEKVGGVDPAAMLLTVIVPGGAETPELDAALTLFANQSRSSIKQRTIAGRKVTSTDDNFLISWWIEEKHFVFTFSNLSLENVVAKFKRHEHGISKHPLYQRLSNFKEFEVVTRGFVDVAGIVAPFEGLGNAFEPALGHLIAASGASDVKSACFWDGFEGEDSRGVIEIDIPGTRRGLTKVFKPAALAMSDLPSLPADLTRFTAARMDLSEIVDLAMTIPAAFDPVTDKKTKPEERIRRRKTEMTQEIESAVGFKLADLFQALGDKVVTYQAPSDGILNLGQVLVVSVKDEKALRRYLDAATRKIEATARQGVVVKKHDCLGIEVRQFVVKDRSPVTISYAICDGWFVIGFQPQPVRGFVHRAKGQLPTWKPDPHTAATLAKVPAERNIIQVADPRATLTWLCAAAPIVSGLTASRDGQEPLLDPGVFPVASEMNKHLFPNVMWCRDDGKVMRWESRDSLWLPGEVIGLEFISIYFGAVGAFFF